MKTLKYILFIGFAAQFINAQSIVIGTGASIDVGAGADICAGEYGNITGTLTGDGTQCTSSVPEILNLVALIEGFYNGTTMVSDVVTVQMRNLSTPYSLVEEKAVTLSTSGTGTANFTSTLNATPYYMVVKHRNSIETWSKTTQTFTGGTLSYDFTTAATQAYGDNLKLKGTKWCIYGGEIANSDQYIDGDDVTAAFNAQGLSGYVIQDVTGDDYVDGDDVTLTFNNQGIGIVKPTISLKSVKANTIKLGKDVNESETNEK